MKPVASVLAMLLAAGALAAPAIPPSLADYGVLDSDGQTLHIRGNTMVYTLASPLFSDYALKFRTLTLPAGSRVGVAAGEEEALDLPVGTIISKTFFYARDPDQPGGWLKGGRIEGGEEIDLRRFQLVETRILRREADGSWLANTYVWDAEQRSASLRRIGLEIDSQLRDSASGKRQALRYSVPNARQCQSCHAVDATQGQAGIQPIGLKLRHLNLDYRYADGPIKQLARLARLGKLEGLPADFASRPASVAYADGQAPLAARARAYLDINCAHCHQALGDARQSGLFLNPAASGSHLGLCKQHVAAGSGGANLRYDIVPGQPAQSLLLSRMQATSGQAMMPRLGRSLVDEDGVALLAQWVSKLPGDCRSHP